jgi:hypothetical protein
VGDTVGVGRPFSSLTLKCGAPENKAWSCPSPSDSTFSVSFGPVAGAGVGVGVGDGTCSDSSTGESCSRVGELGRSRAVSAGIVTLIGF